MKKFIGNLSILIIFYHLAHSPGFANPNSPQVVQGSAAFNEKNGVLTITNSNGAIIDWNRFSIASGEVTRFIQSSPNSSVLNRVIGPEPSLLLGGLYSNGKVFLQNPAGITVGEGGKIDVAGFVATNLGINPEIFKLGGLKFESNNASTGKIENLGEIRTPAGGNVFLIGSNVANQGLIQTPQGQVILAAGQSVELRDSATPNLAVTVTGKDNQAVNLGQIIAASGQIGIIGAMVQNSGLINANQMLKGEGGRIYLRASQDLNLMATSRISADGNLSKNTASCGSVILQSGDGDIGVQTGAVITANGFAGGAIQITANRGDIAMAGNLQASGSGGKGGNIEITGNNVGIGGEAKLQANGRINGGTILIGGGGGLDGAIPNAQTTFVAAGAEIDANGVGNGGRIVVWSDQSTQVHGALSVAGGIQSGDGGFIETSGRILDIHGIHIDTAAVHGQGGEWLLDPATLTVAGSPGADVILNTDLENQLDNGSSIVLQTSGNNGYIRIDSPIVVNHGGVSNLTLESANNIYINANIGSADGRLDLNLHPNYGSGSGGTINIANGVDIDLNGGALAYNNGLTLSGSLQNTRIVSIDNSTLTSKNGVLDGVTLASNLNVGGGNTYLTNGLTLTNGVTLNMGSANWYFQGGDQTLTASGNATLTLAGGGLNLTGVSQTLTLGAGISVKGQGVLGNTQNLGNIVNYGAITANASGRPLTINADTFSNYGSLSAESGILNIAALSFGNHGSLTLNAGRLLILSDNWFNDGIMTETGGLLNLGGGFTTAGLGVIERSGGQLIITGMLDNSNHTLDIGASVFGSGGLSALYGTIENGKLVSGDATILHSSFGTLDNVEIGSNLILGNGGYLFLKNALTLSDGVTLAIGNSNASFLSGGAQAIVSPGNAALTLGGGKLGGFNSGQTLEIGRGVTIGGFGTLGGANPNTIINNGVISPDAPTSLNSPIITLSGNFQQNASGVLDLNLNGASAYPPLMINGAAMLNGALNVTGIANIIDYPILKASTLYGGFSSINAGGMPIAVNYTPTAANLIYQGTLPVAVQTAASYLTPSLLNLTRFYTQTLVAATDIASSRIAKAGTGAVLSLPVQSEKTFTHSSLHRPRQVGDF